MVSTGLGTLKASFMITNVAIDKAMEKAYRSVSYVSLLESKMILRMIDNAVRTKGEPILVISSIKLLKGGLRIIDIALSIAKLNGESSPPPADTAAVITTNVRPENTATSRKKMFLIALVRFILSCI
jgi:hypothetical protein